MYNIYSNHRVPLPQRSRIRKFLMIMTFTKLILLIAVLQTSATALAQKVTLNEKNARLVDVFNDINAQTGYDFAFTTTTLKDAKLVTITVKNKELSDVLTDILKDQNLDFTIENQSVVIKIKDESFVHQVKRQLEQRLAQVTIRGQVQNELGEPLAGVTVREKGTDNAVVTDEKGFYRISTTSVTSVVTFSFIGYDSKEISATSLANGQVITLTVAVNNLREVVINKGYYSEKQALSTGSVSVVSSKTIEEQPVSDPIQALEGRVTGLSIQQNSGVPGANNIVQLRGINSIANGNSPLYVIDGTIYSSISPTNPVIEGGALGNAPKSGIVTGNNIPTGASPFNNLNPDDIESIEVLKDADATSIYGSRGANGVILITTKTGKAGDTKISLDLSQGNGKVTRTMPMMNTQQYLQMRHQALTNDGLTPDPNYDYDLNGVWDTTRYTDWQKILMNNTAHYTNAQLSISGGNETTQFFIGGGFNRQTTVYPGDFDDQKASLNFNLTHSSANKRFKVQLSGGYTSNNSNLPNTDLENIALTLAPDAPALYNKDGSLNWQPVGGTATWNNPLSYTLISTNANMSALTSALNLSYEIAPSLKFSVNMGYNRVNNDQQNITPAISVAPPGNIDPTNRVNNFGNTLNQFWNLEPQLSYAKKIYKGNLNVLIGGSFQQNNSSYSGYNSSNYLSDALLTNPINAGVVELFGYNNTEYRYNGLYSRIGYTWDDKYLINLTARRDGSSRFGPGNQWGNFGSVGAGWIFSKEHFVSYNVPWISFGKIRASYGIVGNDQMPDYQYLSSYATLGTITYQGASVLAPTRIPNPNYHWEVNKKLEFGLDLGFLADRINLTADYYRNRSGNQLVGYGLPFITGFTTVQQNLPAVVQNKGFEFDLNTVNVKSKDFTWSSTINISLPQNKLLSYPNLASSSYANSYVIGQSIFIQKVYKFANIDPQTGVYQFYSGNGQITQSPTYPTDLQATKPITQQYFGGFLNSFSYRGFQLDVFFQFVKQTGYNYWAAGGYFPGVAQNNYPAAILGKQWQKPGDITTYGKFSTFGGADPSFNLTSSDYVIGDASFIRLKNLALSYNLPKNWQRAAHLQSARIYLQAQNLLTFTNYFGLDPETGSNALPPLQMITLGIKTSIQ